VSDRSSIGDFCNDEVDYDEYVAAVSAKLGVAVNKGDSIVVIAQRLKDSEWQ